MKKIGNIIKKILAATLVAAAGLSAWGAEWTEATALPSSVGEYKLTKDVEISSTWTVPTGTVTLDLNGHGIKKTGTSRVISIPNGATLVINDSNPNATHYFDVLNHLAVNINDASGTKNFKGGYITGANASGTTGGAVNMQNGGTLTMNGGTLIGNKADNGAAICAYEQRTSNVNLNAGSKIMYNYATSCGGGIYGAANIILNGVKITNNHADSRYGGIMLNDSGTVTISGATYIKDNTQNPTDEWESNVALDKVNTVNTIMLQLDGLTEGAYIGMYSNGQYQGIQENQPFTSNNGASYAQYFHPDATRPFAISVNADGALVLYYPAASVTTSAGASTNYATLDAALSNWVDGSTLKLLSDLTIDSSIVAPTGTLTFDLNGYGILMTASQTILKVANNTNLTMKDTNPSKVHYVTLTSYRGTAVSDTGTVSAVTAGTGTGVVQITGGYLTGGIASFVSAGGGSYKCGGAVYVEGENGVFTLKSGTIIGNRSDASDGGGIHVAGYGHVNIEGGRICYNKAGNGGGIRIGINGGAHADGIGYVNISGGTIDYNYATEAGGGIRINYGDLTMSGGSVVNNMAPARAGISYEGGQKHIYLSGNPVVKNNKTTAGTDNNIYFSNSDDADDTNDAILYKTGTELLGADAELHVTSHTSPTASADMKIGTGFTKLDLRYIHSDNTANAGTVFCDGTDDWVYSDSRMKKLTGAHHTHAAGTVWLSVAASSENVATNATEVPSAWTITASGNTLTATKTGESRSHYLRITDRSTLASVISAFNAETGLTAVNGSIIYGNEPDTSEVVPSAPGLYTQSVPITVDDENGQISGTPVTLIFPRRILVLSESADNSTAINSVQPGTSVDVAVTRTFGPNVNSLCLPFDLTTAELSALGVPVYKPIATAENGAAKIKFSAIRTISCEAGKPYLVNCASAGSWNAKIFENKTIVKDPVDVTLPGVAFRGTFSQTQSPEAGDKTKLVIKAGGTGFSYIAPGDTTSLRAFRAWFEKR